MSGFVPANPAFEAVVRDSFARQRFMSTLGAGLELVAPGEVHVSAPFSPQHSQQNGFLHAGVLASIGDSACGYAAFTLAPAGHDVLAVEFKVNLMKPATAQRFLACARVLRAGRTLTVALAEIFAVAPAGRELVAVLLSTVIIRSSPPAGAG